jgi:hypothetical protein
MQLIEFNRVGGATEVELLIPTGGYSWNERGCSSNVTFRIGTPQIALQIVCAHRIFCTLGERPLARQRKMKRPSILR